MDVGIPILFHDRSSHKRKPPGTRLRAASRSLATTGGTGGRRRALLREGFGDIEPSASDLRGAEHELPGRAADASRPGGRPPVAASGSVVVLPSPGRRHPDVASRTTSPPRRAREANGCRSRRVRSGHTTFAVTNPDSGTPPGASRTGRDTPCGSPRSDAACSARRKKFRSCLPLFVLAQLASFKCEICVAHWLRYCSDTGPPTYTCSVISHFGLPCVGQGGQTFVSLASERRPA